LSVATLRPSIEKTTLVMPPPRMTAVNCLFAATLVLDRVTLLDVQAVNGRTPPAPLGVDVVLVVVEVVVEGVLVLVVLVDGVLVVVVELDGVVVVVVLVDGVLLVVLDEDVVVVVVGRVLVVVVDEEVVVVVRELDDVVVVVVVTGGGHPVTCRL